MMGFDPKKYLEMLRRNPVLKKEEYEFLRSHAQLTGEIGMMTGRGVTVHSGKEISEDVGLQGASPNIGVIANYEAEDGHFISDTENSRRMNVAFIGHDIKDKFFPGSNAIGQSITAEGIPFQIVGIAKAKGSVFRQSQGNFLIGPVEPYLKRW